MEYRRSVALGLRFTMRVLVALYLLGVAGILLHVGPPWLRRPHLLSDMSHGLFLLELLLGLIERRVNPDPPAIAYPQPSPALSGTAVIVLTGLGAAVATGWNARTASDFAVSITILAVTAVLAAPVYRFAKRNAGEIGEARFDTMKR